WLAPGPPSFCLGLRALARLPEARGDLGLSAVLDRHGQVPTSKRGPQDVSFGPEKTMNLFRTGILMALLTGIFIALGYIIGGGPGMVIAFLFAAGTNLFAYWNSDKMVLSMYGAREVDETSAPDLVHIVRQLAEADGLPMPKIYIAENDQPNAFATGRNPEHA